MKGRLVLWGTVGTLAIMVALLLSFLGLELAFALSWAGLVLAGCALPVLARTGDASPWPPREERATPVVSEVARLAWELRMRNDLVGLAARRRVVALMRRRLARAGLDLDDPAAGDAVDAVLGPGVREALFAQELTFGELKRILDAFEARTEAR